MVHLGRHRCIVVPASSSCCDDSLRSAQHKEKHHCTRRDGCSQSH